MSEVVLKAETGRTTGSRPSKRLRAEGMVPAIVYGHGMPSRSIAVDRRELRLALTGEGGGNALVNLDVDGVNHPTIVKSLQRDPIRRTVSHIDFLVVSLDEVIEVSVPFHLEGEAKAVASEGGLVDPAVDTITVRTKPNTVPGSFTWDITDMAVGDVVRAGELTMPPGVELADDPEMAIVTALSAQAEEPTEGEAEEGAEGEAAEGADAGGGAEGDSSAE
jgi:large subunit ribosomal protein L25